MKVGVIKYPGSNSRSVVNACQRLGVPAFTSSNPESLSECSHLLFPGQGEAKMAMSSLRECGIDTLIKSWKRPFLGICLGFQCLFEFSEEGDTSLLQIVPGVVSRLSANKPLPHTGWSKVIHTYNSQLYNSINYNSYFYFLHSYAVSDSDYSYSSTEYGGERFCSAVRYNNFYGVQFHPEKSGAVGERFLSNFLFGGEV